MIAYRIGLCDSLKLIALDVEPPLPRPLNTELIDCTKLISQSRVLTFLFDGFSKSHSDTADERRE